ncbi:MAG: thrombospondin type 3 repeat-containing protein [Cryomorphaceae bacterium]
MKKYLPLLLILVLCVTCSKNEKVILFELSTSINPTLAGSVTPKSGQFESGESISMTATPSDGYVFKNWSGDVSTTENPLKLTVDNDKNIIAVFEKPDNDNDGIAEPDDQCPNTPAGEDVDNNGCSTSQKDSDGDGINDDIDECPNTENGQEVNEIGCVVGTNDGAGGEVIDIDEDGVADNVDECPETPEGAAVDEQGCSATQKDSDDDGVIDATDTCPETPEGEDVDIQGCSNSQKDTDGDGVTDEFDECVETPEGSTVDAQGCSEGQKDGDNDGVGDDFDQCPETPEGETVDQNGCSDTQKDTDNDGVTDAVDLCPETSEGEDVDETGCVRVLTTSVPDNAFEQLLIDLGYDDVLDDSVKTANISNVETLTINDGLSIVDLTGLEAFESLVTLEINGVVDNTFAFDGSDYPNLTSLFIDNSSLNSIEINEDSNLETLTATITLRTLNVRNNSSLTEIDLEDATINSVNIIGNTELVSYRDLDGTFGNLTISNNSALELIGLNSREVNGLDFSDNAILETFIMRVLTDVAYPLDFSTCPNLKLIGIGGNEGRFLSIDISTNNLLEILNVSDSGLTSLDISNNNSLIELDASTNNPLLTCIRVNQSQLDSIPSDWVIDSQTNYALECPE